MFSFGERKKKLTVSTYMRRICDVTTSRPLPDDAELRSDGRYNRTIPTLVGEWVDGRVADDQVVFALTRDISDNGVCLVFPRPFCAERALVGFWLGSIDQAQEPWFFLGTTCRNSPLGGGFWLVGIELTEFANENYRSAITPLLPLAQRLAPREVAQHCPA